jgi:hypothetical protein
MSTAGYAEGGTVGIVTPRPSPIQVSQARLSQDLRVFAERPIYTVVTEVNDTQNRVNIIEAQRSL